MIPAYMPVTLGTLKRKILPIQHLDRPNPSTAWQQPTTPAGFVWKCWVNIPNEIAIFHRDNDQQNHWV